MRTNGASCGPVALAPRASPPGWPAPSTRRPPRGRRSNRHRDRWIWHSPIASGARSDPTGGSHSYPGNTQPMHADFRRHASPVGWMSAGRARARFQPSVSTARHSRIVCRFATSSVGSRAVSLPTLHECNRHGATAWSIVSASRSAEARIVYRLRRGTPLRVISMARHMVLRSCRL